MEMKSWDEMYEIARGYYEHQGNLLVPIQYVSEENIKLGAWIANQRKQYKTGKLTKDRIELLEKIGIVWSVYETQWVEYYRLAKSYYDENGNLLVPLLYTTNDGVRLGSWIGTQRKQHKEGELSDEKIELLERIGMVWSVYDAQWNECYNLSVDYYNNNGDLLVPLRYKTNGGVKLGSWISGQRRAYKAGKLSKERIKLLEKIGMVWDGISAAWEDMYNIAKQYYEENKNLSISSTVFTYRNVSLGSWVVTQRKNYFLKRLSDQQIALLNKIGMEWVYTNNPDYVWEKNYKTVLEFYSKYKHLYIPISYVTEDGVRLGVWLYDRKLEYERNELSEERKRKLDKLDKTWLESINTKSSFPEQAVMFYIRKAFPSATKLSTKEISEIDIYIPELKTGIEYDGPSHNNRIKDDIKKSQACKKVGIKLIRIRDSELPIINDESYKIVLKDDTLDALDSGISTLLHHLSIFDINVCVKRDYIEIADNYIKSIDLDWYLMYEKLRTYYKEHGNINVPIYYTSPDGTQLGHWLSNLRSSYKNPQLGNIRLNTNKIKLLEDLGMDWAPIESQWESMYLLAKKYYEENGNLLIPNKYITAENVKLGKWLGTQRYNYKEGILAKDKIALLEKIGIVWTVSDYEWMKMYDLAAIYYKENGNLLVHNKYKTKDNISLGAWVGQQRTNHYNKKLSKKKIELLDKIGMVWSLSDYEWMRMYSLATRYYAEKGNLAVPKDYKTKGNEYLGAWIDRQRKQKQDNKLSSKQINLLNKIGMEWSKTDYKWMAIYNSAVSYYDDHGDLLVPSRYATDDGIHLGTWIKHQRERYKKGIITATEEELLNNIDMIWDLKEIR